jgi:hypothetical protein
MAALLRAGFEAVGSRMPVEADGDAVSVRDLLIEFDGAIVCHSAADGIPREVFRMPLEAAESAACAVVVRVMTGVVSRAIESAASSAKS